MVDHAIVAVLGVLVAVGELSARYRDAPLIGLLRSTPAIVYMAINAAAALAALVVVDAFGWTFGVSPDTGHGSAARLTQLLVAGFGSVALFRTSLFTVRAGDRDIAVGPSTFLQLALGAADREVDRLRAEARVSAVTRIMRDVSFEKARQALAAYCLALMQNLPKEDQEQLARQLAALGDATMSDEFKSLLLGLALMNVVGEGVLTAAVDSLKGQLRRSPGATGTNSVT